jgi:hypothetical protein
MWIQCRTIVPIDHKPLHPTFVHLLSHSRIENTTNSNGVSNPAARDTARESPHERLGQSFYNVEIAAGHLVPESVESPVPLLLRRLELRTRPALLGASA